MADKQKIIQQVEQLRSLRKYLKKQYSRIRIALLILYILLGTIAGGLFMIVTSDKIPISYFDAGEYLSLITGMVNGFIITSILVPIELYLFELIRIKIIIVNILVKTMLYGLVICLSYTIVDLIIGGVPRLVYDLNHDFYLAVLYATIILLIFIFTININRLLGHKGLLRLLFGMYHTPSEEVTFFMFLDLTSSTALAEKIGNIQFYSFLNDFFFDITRPILNTGGEIYKYVGDEIIVTWKLNRGIKNNNCLNCFFLIQETLRDRWPYYEKRYGTVPKFTAALHCGNAIVGEMGDFKKEIAYLGDVVNTTSRMQNLCRKVNSDFLISGEVINQLGGADIDYLTIERLGKIQLRGKENFVTLHSVSAVEDSE